MTPADTSSNASFSDACILRANFETNGFQGGDAGHGGETRITFLDEGGTAMDLVDMKEGSFTMRFKGDAELRVLAQAIHFLDHQLAPFRGEGTADQLPKERQLLTDCMNVLDEAGAAALAHGNFILESKCSRFSRYIAGFLGLEPPTNDDDDLDRDVSSPCQSHRDKVKDDGCLADQVERLKNGIRDHWQESTHGATANMRYADKKLHALIGL